MQIIEICEIQSEGERVMKLYAIMTMAILGIMLTGCTESAEQGPDRHIINSELINTYSDIAVQNAIISQHTLYPYHFEKNSAELNELGLRDLGVLAAHFGKTPGRLNVRRDSTPADIYQARIKLVLDKLQEAGINVDQMSVADGMPGGPGMLSEKIIMVLQEEYKAPVRN